MSLRKALVLVGLAMLAAFPAAAQEVRQIDLSPFTSLSPTPENPNHERELRQAAIVTAYNTLYSAQTRVLDSLKIRTSGKPILLLVKYKNGAREVFEVWSPVSSPLGKFVDGSINFPPSTGTTTPAIHYYATPIYEYVEVGRWVYASVTVQGSTHGKWVWLSDGYVVHCVALCDAGTPWQLVN